MPHRHRHIPRPGPNRADALDFPQDVFQVRNPVRFLHNAHQQHIAVRVQRPQIGGVIILRRRQPPIARRDAIPPAPFPLRLKVGRPRHLRIPRRRHRRPRILHRVKMRQHQPINPAIQRLLQHPLVALPEIRRHPHQRRRIRLQRPAARDFLARQQKLKRHPQLVKAEILMLHLNDGHIVIRIRHKGQILPIPVPNQPGTENRLPPLQQLNNLVVTNHNPRLSVMIFQPSHPQQSPPHPHHSPLIPKIPLPTSFPPTPNKPPLSQQFPPPTSFPPTPFHPLPLRGRVRVGASPRPRIILAQAAIVQSRVDEPAKIP